MKTFSYFLVISLFLSLLFIGCEKDKPEPVVPQPYIEAFAVPAKGPVGDSILITLNWDIKNATVGYLDGIPLETLKGSKELYIFKSTNFVFLAKNDAGDQDRLEVFAQGPVFDLPTIELTATPDTLPIGGGIVTISWTSQNTDSVLIEGVWYIEPNGSIQIERNATSTLSALAKGKGGEFTSTLTITVLQLPTITELLCVKTRTLVKKEDCDTATNGSCYTYWSYESSLSCEQDLNLTFSQNHNLFVDFGVQCEGENFSNSNCQWSLSSDEGVIMFPGSNQEWKIVYLSEDTLIFTYPSVRFEPNNVTVPILIRNTFAYLHN